MLTELENGAQIIAQTPTADGGYIVLARTRGYQPLVTWWADSKGVCFNGHYFFEDDEGCRAAFEDFAKRS